ncbi:MAG: 4-hydroxybenzoate 3-monooxygenase [Acetobacteraceae bacterium SCN 69-10]|nr:4-hydroxybenzoate 3-monooxygenase [Rhodospirillales bacterium]ODU56953.1 MAG: 4-hydroxybenzoate 3-monooxygenase [Acetobacteraceae bacterium SCN 69-10]OJY67850.1 MAG: 4-hydroxybenzoate 3-monooxygenase [Rhodospirillales bacterium 70-18]
MRTQVGIVGAGPAGLLLGHLLHLAGIDSVILEARSRAHVESRIRAGVMEHQAAELLRAAGLGARMDREGLVHHGVVLRFGGASHRIDLTELSGGRSIMVYGQHEVVRDLIAARLAAELPILFDADCVAVDGFMAGSPRIAFRHDGAAQTLECDIIAGCDGFHGICRPAMPTGTLREFDRSYPFGWLGILAEVAPASEELVYASHDRGFALLSMRSPTVSRLYLQVAPDEDLGQWPDSRIWDELRLRLADEAGFVLPEGPILQKGVTAMRSYVAEPMQAGRLFLLGDAAHIVPPTGAKGMNLAFADVAVLARALDAWFASGDAALLDAYSATALRRVWKAERFSWWMTSLLHRFDSHGPFERRMQLAELDYITSSPIGAATLAENYVGLPVG